MSFTLTSPGFEQGKRIPSRYTCDGKDLSPPLAWTDPPPGTRSLALLMDDPDAPSGVYSHWVVQGIPPSARSLAEGTGHGATLPPGSVEGRNSGGGSGYSGPCPPKGTHRYFFRLFALDSVPHVEGEATREKLLGAMEGHVIATAELMGPYARE